jgi:hypothetical protein
MCNNNNISSLKPLLGLKKLKSVVLDKHTTPNSEIEIFKKVHENVNLDIFSF